MNRSLRTGLGASSDIDLQKFEVPSQPRKLRSVVGARSFAMTLIAFHAGPPGTGRSKSSTMAVIDAPFVAVQLLPPLIITGASFMVVESHAARVRRLQSQPRPDDLSSGERRRIDQPVEMRFFQIAPAEI